MLKYLERDQIKLSFYANNLNYNLKKHQTYILNKLLLGDATTNASLQLNNNKIDKYIGKLDKFFIKHAELSSEFSKKLKIIKKRLASYKIVQKSLIEAIRANDSLDIEDALIGYNAIAEKFSQDTLALIELGNAHQYQEIYLLQKENKNLSYVLIFSFITAFLLVFVSIMQFQRLNKKIRQQLIRAENAEADLQTAQKQLLKYNDDLESEIARKTAELHEKIYTNFISGLPNRNKLLEDAQHYTFSKMAILNIDKFQSFNDVYGEEVGNIAIRMSAEFLKKKIINTKLSLYHLGGDEFVLICKIANETVETFINLIEQILKDYKAEKFIYEDKTFQFMMSAGISYSAKKKMLAYADMALKDAKKRNIQLSVFSDNKELEKEHKDDIECHKKLMEAMEKHKILSYFQPITPIQDHTLSIKYESLVRIEYDGKIIPPFRFIDVAKANRVYHRITRYVIQNTLEAIQKYKIPCSLNISLSDIENERTMNHLFETIRTFEYNDLLTIELLETEDFKNYDAVYNFCVKVRSYGLKVALDDFGSGYSNFSHILHLPVDYIKIDATLISNIDRDHNSRLMVETIVDLAKKLHVMTIAEFVSSKEILEVVTEIGVDYAQGYYLGKPAPIEEHLDKRKLKS